MKTYRRKNRNNSFFNPSREELTDYVEDYLNNGGRIKKANFPEVFDLISRSTNKVIFTHADEFLMDIPFVQKVFSPGWNMLRS
ncbi:MAG: hypothetical protein OEY59_09030 [Deltaproteobacteria bacterium]|nr:hypothetical protein [Deltaproteobacteria bacterium]